MSVTLPNFWLSLDKQWLEYLFCTIIIYAVYESFKQEGIKVYSTKHVVSGNSKSEQAVPVQYNCTVTPPTRAQNMQTTKHALVSGYTINTEHSMCWKMASTPVFLSWHADPRDKDSSQ